MLKDKGGAKLGPAPGVQEGEGGGIGVITVGGWDPAVREALELLAAQGIQADYMRVRGFPFPESVEEFINSHDHTLVIEQNRDAQLKGLITLETNASKEKMQSLLVYGGFPLRAKHVV